MSLALHVPVRTAAGMTDRVAVGFSGGKDSVVTLDLCARHFPVVRPYFMYLVPGLSFQEAQLRWAERRYGVDILRLPHPMLSTWLHFGVFRRSGGEKFPEITFGDVTAYVRQQTGCWWLAGGERIADSIVRRAMLKRSGSIDDKRGRVYPLAHFTLADVRRYLALRRLKTSPESQAPGLCGCPVPALLLPI